MNPWRFAALAIIAVPLPARAEQMQRHWGLLHCTELAEHLDGMARSGASENVDVVVDGSLDRSRDQFHIRVARRQPGSRSEEAWIFAPRELPCSAALHSGDTVEARIRGLLALPYVPYSALLQEQVQRIVVSFITAQLRTAGISGALLNHAMARDIASSVGFQGVIAKIINERVGRVQTLSDDGRRVLFESAEFRTRVETVVREAMERREVDLRDAIREAMERARFLSPQLMFGGGVYLGIGTAPGTVSGGFLAHVGFQYRNFAGSMEGRTDILVAPHPIAANSQHSSFVYGALYVGSFVMCAARLIEQVPGLQFCAVGGFGRYRASRALYGDLFDDWSGLIGVGAARIGYDIAVTNHLALQLLLEVGVWGPRVEIAMRRSALPAVRDAAPWTPPLCWGDWGCGHAALGVGLVYR